MPKDLRRLAIPEWSDAVVEMMLASAQVRGKIDNVFPAVELILHRTVRELSVGSANRTCPEVIFSVSRRFELSVNKQQLKIKVD